MAKIHGVRSRLLGCLKSLGGEMLKSTRALTEVNFGSYNCYGLINLQQKLDTLFGVFCQPQHLLLVPENPYDYIYSFVEHAQLSTLFINDWCQNSMPKKTC